MSWPPPPPTRIISWAGLVQEADPDYLRKLIQPIIYEFSNGRDFVAPASPYANFAFGIGYDAIGFFNIGVN